MGAQRETKFKVGDRVRYDGRSATIREYHSRISAGPYFIEFDEDVGFGHNGNGLSERPLNNNRGWWAVEHLLSHAPLTVRAGRYYKTRDGRKVGPMLDFGNETWLDFGNEIWHVKSGGNFGGSLWRGDGTVIMEGNAADLVAEWTEPTVAKAKFEIANDSGGWDVIGGLTGLTFKAKLVDTPRPFKIGDRVEFTSACPKGWWFVPHKAHKGGVVEKIGSLNYNVRVAGSAIPAYVGPTQIRHAPSTTGSTTGFTVPLFDVPATPATKKKAIVCLIENGQPAPSLAPHVHATIEAAEREARRLARKYKGKEFVVFEWSTSVKETPAYQHEWQRLAASGLDESAASELSKLSGLSWDTAHAAVLRAA